MFLILIILINVSSYFPQYKNIYIALKNAPFRCFGLTQKWNMFSPDPTKINLYTLIVGETDSGKKIDLKTLSEFKNYNLTMIKRPPSGYNTHSYNLGFYSTFLGVEDYKNFETYFANDLFTYYTKRYYSKLKNKIVKVSFIQMVVETTSPGKERIINIIPLKEFRL